MTTVKTQSWKRMRFADFVDTAPKSTLEKSREYPFIPMELIDGASKYPTSSYKKKFSGGGSRFMNGDTVFARITPCLENGKIAQIKNLPGDVGFGSTEFFVFRNKEGVSDKDFIYYLSRTEEVRSPAIKSMVGASGRQRADKSVVENLEVLVPSISKQQDIAGILSKYDDLIEKNTRRIQILEQMARAVYTERFVNFRFPGHEKVNMIDSGTDFGKIPEGWEVKRIGDVFSVKYGKNLPKTKIAESGEYPVYGAGGVIGFYVEKNVDEKTALITSRGNGSGTVWRTKGAGFVTNNSFTVVGNNEHRYLDMSFIYSALLNASIGSSISGSAQPQVTINSLNYVEVIVPEKNLVKSFQSEIYPLYILADKLFLMNQNLRQTRDLLLPKLVTGEIQV